MKGRVGEINNLLLEGVYIKKRDPVVGDHPGIVTGGSGHNRLFGRGRGRGISAQGVGLVAHEAEPAARGSG